MNLDLVLGLLVVIPFLGGILARRLKFPMITGYLVIGMILSPSVAGIISEDAVADLTAVVAPIALALIAYLIGGNLSLSSLSGLKKTIGLVSAGEAVCAWGLTAFLVVVVAPLVVGDTAGIGPQGFLVLGIVAGGISLATAPVATVAIAREYRARGPLTSTLLGVLALDNSLAIVGYAMAVAAVSLLMGVSGVSIWLGVGQAAGRIAASWMLGAGFAWGLRFLWRLAKRKSELVLLVVGTAVLCDGVARLVGLSGLMATLVLGVTTANLPGPSRPLFDALDDVEELVYALFLALVGAHLNPGLLPMAGPLALLVVLGRMGGKYLGARLGATVAGAPPVVRRYLGMTLLAKAGLTLGLVLLVKRDLAFVGAATDLLINAILASTIINELVAPPLVRLALVRSGEVGAPSPEVAPELRGDPMRMITVGQAMTRDFPTVPETMPVAELATLFGRTGHHGFPVVDGEGRLSGIVALSDVQRTSVEGDTDLNVGAIATREVVTAFPDQSLHQALQQFGALDVGRLPVVERHDPRRLVGVLRRRDIVSAYSRAVQQRQERQPAPGPLATLSSNHLLTVELNPACAMLGKPVAQLGLPKDCLLVAIDRGGGLIIPRGDTVLQAGDQITIVASPAARDRAADISK